MIKGWVRARVCAVFALVLMLSSCTGPRAAAPPPVVEVPPAPPPPPPNLIVTAYEVVERPEEDALAKVRVFVDGQAVGETDPGLLSAPKKWEGRISPGNHPVRFERWVMRRVSDWVKDDAAEVPERFLRIPEDQAASFTIRYFDGGRRYEVLRN